MLNRFLMRSQHLLATQKRFFDLHEYHSKRLMASYGINV
jgi:hypothetical protein